MSLELVNPIYIKEDLICCHGCKIYQKLDILYCISSFCDYLALELF